MEEFFVNLNIFINSILGSSSGNLEESSLSRNLYDIVRVTTANCEPQGYFSRTVVDALNFYWRTYSASFQANARILTHITTNTKSNSNWASNRLGNFL